MNHKLNSKKYLQVTGSKAPKHEYAFALEKWVRNGTKRDRFSKILENFRKKWKNLEKIEKN